MPIAGGLALSAPISVLSSRASLGRIFRRARLFAIPEELNPPVELQATSGYHRSAPTPPGFADAVVDPVLNALACVAGRSRLISEAHALVTPAVIRSGPAVLSAKQKNALLDDPESLSQLHFEVWKSSPALNRWEGLQ